MTNIAWQLPKPVSAIVFDCDGTLSKIEGVNELADENGVGPAVAALTEEAMGRTGLNPILYQKRLDLIAPCKEQVFDLGNKYYKNHVADAQEVIALFHQLQKSVYIVSAGLSPGVTLFGELLAIPKENIFAVDIEFDVRNQFLSFDKHCPLIHNDGKKIIVQELKKLHANILHVGDGMNDCITRDIVTRFVGYGGVFYRKNIQSCCEYYISSESLAALLPLTLTASESTALTAEAKELYLKGLQGLVAAG